MITYEDCSKNKLYLYPRMKTEPVTRLEQMQRYTYV